LKDREDLFYSLLYRGLQAPFLISEKTEFMRLLMEQSKSKDSIYNGWAIWDNYRAITAFVFSLS
jgi:putative alpha-1,2-mannosidase